MIVLRTAFDSPPPLQRTAARPKAPPARSTAARQTRDLWPARRRFPAVPPGLLFAARPGLVWCTWRARQNAWTWRAPHRFARAESRPLPGARQRRSQPIVLAVRELQAQLAGTDAAVRRAKDEIRRAQSDVERAKSTHSASHAMYTRLSQAAQQKEGLVAQQEIDDAQAKDLGSDAQLSSAQAALSAAQQSFEVAEASRKQYEALSFFFKQKTAYAGVITLRYADTGALVAAGTSTSTQSMPVVRLAQVSKLRLVLPIPESIAAQIHLGDPVKVRVQALNKDFVGKISRFADSLDMQTRTMETEIDFENSSGLIIPGMYTGT